MKTIFAILILLSACLVGVREANANAAPIRPANTEPRPLEIRSDPQARVGILQIPASFLKDVKGNQGASNDSPLRFRSMIAALAISAAVVCAVFMSRLRLTNHPAAKASMIVGILAFVGGVVRADIALPPRFDPEKFSSQVQIEVVKDGKSIVLTLPELDLQKAIIQQRGRGKGPALPPEIQKSGTPAPTSKE